MNLRAPSPETEPALRVSVVVPVLNEEGNLPRCLAPVLAASEDVEVIVVDGGSHDRSVDLARKLGATVLVSSVVRRAAQMNLGAQAAHGDVLVFLHADTILPPGWLPTLQLELQRCPEAVGGVFRRRFRHQAIFLRITCWLADWRARWFGWFLGDQTIFARRAAFEAAGGYRALTAFEDLDFSLRLKRCGRTILLPATALSSGRRFEARGPLMQTLADFRLTIRFARNRESFAAVEDPPK